MSDVFVHESAYVDAPSDIGPGTKIWHFCHIMAGATLGPDCNLGQNVFIASGVVLGRNVKIQNNVSLYAGVICGDDVFLGPSCVFTNVRTPRSAVNRRGDYAPTVLGKGVSVGANATIVCGCTIGEYAFIAAGAVVTKDVPPHALIMGVPGRIAGWACRCGATLSEGEGATACPECAAEYTRDADGRIVPGAGPS